MVLSNDLILTEHILIRIVQHSCAHSPLVEYVPDCYNRFYVMDEWTKYIQENNVVVQVLIVSRYKVTWQIILYCV